MQRRSQVTKSVSYLNTMLQTKKMEWPVKGRPGVGPGAPAPGSEFQVLGSQTMTHNALTSVKMLYSWKTLKVYKPWAILGDLCPVSYANVSQNIQMWPPNSKHHSQHDR